MDAGLPADIIDPDEAQWLTGGAAANTITGSGLADKDRELLRVAAGGDSAAAIELCRSGARLDSLDREGRGAVELCWISGKGAAAKEFEAFATSKDQERAMARAARSKSSLSTR